MSVEYDDIDEAALNTSKKHIDIEGSNKMDNLSLREYLHTMDKNILAHRKEDFAANKKFGTELKDIHKMLSKGILLIVVLVFFCGCAIGGTIVAFSDVILPFLGYALDTAKTASNLIR